MQSVPEDAQVLLKEWFGPPADAATMAERQKPLWWEKDAARDRALAERYGEAVAAAREGRLEHWAVAPRGTLALILLLDQVARNIHRDTPLAYAGDAAARHWTRTLLTGRTDRELEPLERVFVYMPLEHAENLEDQETCMALFEELAESVDPEHQDLFRFYLDFARRHRDIIARFGRFPHRNAVLGRTSTEEEAAFLKEPGSSF